MILHHVFDNVYLADDAVRGPSDGSAFAYISMSSIPQYSAYCDDFGPMCLGSIFQFCNLLQDELDRSSEQSIVVCAESSRTSITNAVFLLGAFLILKRREHPQQVQARFESLSPLLLSYRDISPGKQNFELHIEDCWEALNQAQGLSWISCGPDGFDSEEYFHYDHPLNADLHVIVPNKIVAMKGPTTTPDGKLWHDTPEGARDFSAAYYADLLPDFDVSLVVRLNKPEYDAKDFESAGIAVADLFFEDCHVPPPDVVVKFLLMAEGLPGAIAVHCKAGLGRTGTLIALYLMKTYGFTARQAIAWLRIVRPGSVIGRQQQFLVDKEPTLTRMRAHPSSGRLIVEALSPSPPPAREGSERWGLDRVRDVVGRIVRRVDRSSARCSSPPEQLAVACPAQSHRVPRGEDAAREGLAAHVGIAAQRRGSARSVVPVGGARTD